MSIYLRGAIQLNSGRRSTDDLLHRKFIMLILTAILLFIVVVFWVRISFLSSELRFTEGALARARIDAEYSEQRKQFAISYYSSLLREAEARVAFNKRLADEKMRREG